MNRRHGVPADGFLVPALATATVRHWRRLATHVLVGLLLVLASARPSSAETVLHVERSTYQTIVVADHEGRRCMRFGEEASALNQSCVVLAAPGRLEFSYARAMVAVTLMWRPEPQRILIIGVGGGSIPTALAAALPSAQIDAVDLDPAVIDVARRYFGFAPDGRLRAIAADGRDFVQLAVREGRRYDAVLLDAFDAEGIPPALFDRTFLSDVRQLVQPDGAFLANTFSASPRYAQESADAEAVFGLFLNIKLGSDSGGNRLLVAATGPLPSPAALQAIPRERRADFERIGASESWLRSWRFAGRDWLPAR